MRSNSRLFPLLTISLLVLGLGCDRGEADLGAEVGADVPVSLHEMWRIGELQGEEPDVFGRISDVAVDARGRIFVADAGALRIKVFDEEGHFIVEAGRRGEGPGEFRLLAGLDWLDGDLLSSDPALVRLTRWSLQGHHLVPVGQVSVDLTNVYAMCVLAGQVFVLGYRDGRILHQVDEEGAVVHSFGEPFVRVSRMAEAVSSAGELLCTIEPEPSVVVFPKDGPVLRAYRPNGSLRWESPVEGFRALIYVPKGPGRMGFEHPEGGRFVDKAVSLARLGGDLLVAQFGTMRPARHAHVDDISSVTSYLYDLGNGALMAATERLPRIDAVGLDERVVYAVTNLPYPQLIAYRLER